jgi:large subunit ribosomal protein L5
MTKNAETFHGNPNPMKELQIDKVVVHMSVGEGGQRLINAEQIIKTLTGQQTVRTAAKKTQPVFGIRKGQAIGCKTTLRRSVADKFLKTALDTRQYHINDYQFDENGNLSFGIVEHTDFPGMTYDPEIGIFGMDVTVTFKKSGYRITKRRITSRRIPNSHKVKRAEAIAFMKDKCNAVIE